MEGYNNLSPDARKDLESSLVYTAKLWCEVLLSGERLPEAFALELREIGRRRVHQGVPLQSLMRGYSLGAREIWRTYLEQTKATDEIDKEQLLSISAFTFDFFDSVAETVTQAYLDEQIQKTRWREYLNHRLYHILFHSPQEVTEFQQTLLALGIDPSIPRVALALDVALQTTQPLLREEELDRLTLLIARCFKIPAKELVRIWYRDRLLVWLPGIQGETMSQCDQRVARHAASLQALIPPLRCIGLGMVNSDVGGWVSSAEEALKAIDLFACDQGEPRIRRYSRVLIEDSVRSHKNVLRYLVSLVEQLNSEPELLLTLEAYFAQGRRRSQTAKILDIHPNTLNYRLGRIENLLYADLNDINWISKLDAALRLRKHSINKIEADDE
ncbi:PucR family transcriptional regulator [Pseudomonas sp. NPDC089530]|uniref:PucR family transcriptional regulator n=1 Tax=Pseudomonas sp. NPDC089530 TaxID=3390651 RepID=UPI003CFBD5E5